MESNVQRKPDDLLRYFPNGDVHIKLDNILTKNQIVHPNELLLKVEGQHYDNIQLLSVRDQNGMVYHLIKDLKTGSVHEISQRLDPDNGYFVWWVTSYEYVAAALEDRVIEQLKGNVPLEFDF